MSEKPIPETEPQEEGRKKGPKATSPRAQAAGALVGSLAKAARAFTLYDPGNALVRQFIAEFRSRAEEATREGEVVLDVRPFELGLGEEVVYEEEDRERSLAFKLFRDGIRRLSFSRGVSPEELFRLLEIMAVRFVGVRQAEDDLVTLMRKAEYDLACSAPGSEARRDALETLENITRVQRQRALRPRPPGF